MGSSPMPVERNVDSGIRITGEELASSTGGLWVASSSLASEYESRLREITELREPEVIDVGLQPVHKNASDPIAPVPAATDIMHQSRINVDASHQTEGNEMIDTATSSYSDSLLLSDHLISSALEKAQSTGKCGIQPSSEVGVGPVGESQIHILDLHPIPEENLDDDKPEEDHENLTKPESFVGLTGSQILEEPRIFFI